MVDKPALSVSDTTAISMPVRNLLSIVVAVCIGVWSYFGIVERLNRLETFEKLGQPPADGEQFMLIEHLGNQVEKIQTRLEQGMSNGVNIKRLQEDVQALRQDVEKLKDKQRGLTNGTYK